MFELEGVYTYTHIKPKYINKQKYYKKKVQAEETILKTCTGYPWGITHLRDDLWIIIGHRMLGVEWSRQCERDSQKKEIKDK